MRQARDFSVVMATYTGEDTIDEALSRLRNQKKPDCNLEFVIVIDGPNDDLRKKIELHKKDFAGRELPFKIKQFDKNRGRFEARLAGARLARYDYLLIVDDRVGLPDNFFRFVSSSREEVIIPDVTESAAKNLVSLTLSRVRRILYRGNWFSNFKPFYIDGNNFDRSPKGTTALWVKKMAFIDACDALAEQSDDTKHVNEDTRVLRAIIDSGLKIYKTSEVKLVYEPRSSAINELTHVYHRGPRFIDYYLHPGTRYFLPLAVFYLATIPLLVLIVLWPVILLAAVLTSFLVSLWAGKVPSDWLKILIGLWALAIWFGAGLWVGLIKSMWRAIR